MNRIAIRLVPLAIVAALSVGCAEHPARTANPPVASTTTGSSAASSTPVQRSATSTSTMSSTTPRADDEAAVTGIPACDDYLASYKGCHRAAQIYAADTIDGHYREMHDSLLKQSKDAATRDQLAARCVALADQLKQSLHGKACEPEAAMTSDQEP